MPKVYVWNDRIQGKVLLDRSIVTFGKEFKPDQIDPEQLENYLGDGRVKEVTAKKSAVATPPAPVESDKGKGKGKGKGGK